MDGEKSLRMMRMRRLLQEVRFLRFRRSSTSILGTRAIPNSHTPTEYAQVQQCAPLSSFSEIGIPPHSTTLATDTAIADGGHVLYAYHGRAEPNINADSTNVITLHGARYSVG